MLRDQCLLRAAAPAPAAHVKCLPTSAIGAAWHGTPHATPAARQHFGPPLAVGSGAQPLRSALPARPQDVKAQLSRPAAETAPRSGSCHLCTAQPRSLPRLPPRPLQRRGATRLQDPQERAGAPPPKPRAGQSVAR